MYRFYDPQAGSITLGGRDLRQLPLSTIRDSISVVTQDTYLFHGTVADNCAFGKPDATREELEEAARAANAHGFISQLRMAMTPLSASALCGSREASASGWQSPGRC